MGNVAQTRHCRCLCAPLCIDSEKTFAEDLDWDSSGSAGAMHGGADAQTRAKRIVAQSVFHAADAASEEEAIQYADPTTVAGLDAALLVHSSLLPSGLSNDAIGATFELVEEPDGDLPAGVASVQPSEGLCEGIVGEENAVNGTDRNVQLVFSLGGGISELQPANDAAHSGTSSPRLRTVSFGSEDGSFAGFQELAAKTEGQYLDDEEGNEAVMEEKTDNIGRAMRQQGFTRVKGMFV